MYLQAMGDQARGVAPSILGRRLDAVTIGAGKPGDRRADIAPAHRPARLYWHELRRFVRWRGATRPTASRFVACDELGRCLNKRDVASVGGRPLSAAGQE